MACSRSAPPAEAPAPAPEPVASTPVSPPASSEASPLGQNATREFRGAYTRGFEASWFAPCDTPRDDALWWVTLTEDARLQRDRMLEALTAAPTGALAVRWRGTISPRMQAGQMGHGTRYILVTEILEVRPLPSTGACSGPLRSTSRRQAVPMLAAF
jgi:hypothetical protein